MFFTNNLDKIKTNVDAIYFIHIPKTSGKALESPKINKLGHGFNIRGAHRTPSHLKGFAGYKSKKWKKYVYPVKNNLKITIIRNPFDLLCSYYFHGEQLKKNGKYCHSGWAAVNYTHQFKTFKEFITAYCDEKFKWHQPLFKQFLYSQLFNRKDKCVADIVIKYEFLNKGIGVLNEKGMQIATNSVHNVSSNKKMRYDKYYDDEMIEMVKRKCARELKAFKYDFNGSIDDNAFIVDINMKYNIKKDKMYF